MLATVLVTLSSGLLGSHRVRRERAVLIADTFHDPIIDKVEDARVIGRAADVARRLNRLARFVAPVQGRGNVPTPGDDDAVRVVGGAGVCEGDEDVCLRAIRAVDDLAGREVGDRAENRDELLPDGWPEARPSVTPNWAPNPPRSWGSDGIATVETTEPEPRLLTPIVGVTFGSPGCFVPSKEKL